MVSGPLKCWNSRYIMYLENYPNQNSPTHFTDEPKKAFIAETIEFSEHSEFSGDHEQRFHFSADVDHDFWRHNCLLLGPAHFPVE